MAETVLALYCDIAFASNQNVKMLQISWIYLNVIARQDIVHRNAFISFGFFESLFCFAMQAMHRFTVEMVVTFCFIIKWKSELLSISFLL